MNVGDMNPGVRFAPSAAASVAATRPGAGSRDAEVREVRRAMEQLVASALVEPALSTARSGSLAAGPFAPGDTERRFGPLLDQAIAEHVVRGANFPLVDRLTEHFLGREIG